jgi:hypothetical protein
MTAEYQATSASRFADGVRLLRDGVPRAEIARRWGVSRQRVEQVVGRAALRRVAAEKVERLNQLGRELRLPHRGHRRREALPWELANA